MLGVERWRRGLALETPRRWAAEEKSGACEEGVLSLRFPEAQPWQAAPSGDLAASQTVWGRAWPGNPVHPHILKDNDRILSAQIPRGWGQTKGRLGPGQNRCARVHVWVCGCCIFPSMFSFHWGTTPQRPQGLKAKLEERTLKSLNKQPQIKVVTSGGLGSM